MIDSTFELNGTDYSIPQWFAEKKLSQNERIALEQDDDPWEVRRETEKAVLLRQMTDFGAVNIWVPKSILVGPEQREAAHRKAVARQERYDAYYAYLRNTAKENGVKLGNVRKWAKIQAKLDEAGVRWTPFAEYAA